eukprot:jgi/Bigna1/73549/fgenesh1_pg.24_\
MCFLFLWGYITTKPQFGRLESHHLFPIPRTIEYLGELRYNDHFCLGYLLLVTSGFSERNFLVSTVPSGLLATTSITSTIDPKLPFPVATAAGFIQTWQLEHRVVDGGQGTSSWIDWPTATGMGVVEEGVLHQCERKTALTTTTNGFLLCLPGAEQVLRGEGGGLEGKQPHSIYDQALNTLFTGSSTSIVSYFTPAALFGCLLVCWFATALAVLYSYVINSSSSSRYIRYISSFHDDVLLQALKEPVRFEGPKGEQKWLESISLSLMTPRYPVIKLVIMNFVRGLKRLETRGKLKAWRIEEDHTKRQQRQHQQRDHSGQAEENDNPKIFQLWLRHICNKEVPIAQAKQCAQEGQRMVEKFDRYDRKTKKLIVKEPYILGGRSNLEESVAVKTSSQAYLMSQKRQWVISKKDPFEDFKFSLSPSEKKIQNLLSGMLNRAAAIIFIDA